MSFPCDGLAKLAGETVQLCLLTQVSEIQPRWHAGDHGGTQHDAA